MAKKNFTSGLDMLIQKTSVIEAEPEKDSDIHGLQEEQEVKEIKNEPKELEKQLSITIPVSLKRELKKFCASNDISIKDLIIKSVINEMAKN